MQNYIIGSNTVALLKLNKKTLVYNVNNYLVINKSIKSIINYNCEFYYTNLDVIKKKTKDLLNIKYKVPILIGNNILIQLNSLRNNDAILIMLDKIIDYNYVDNILYIHCVNNLSFQVNISLNNFENLLFRSIKLNNILKYQKNANFL